MSAPRRTAWLLGLAALSLAVFLAEVLLGLGAQPAPTRGSDGYSLSGLGHAALLDLLQEEGVPVLRSRWASAERVEPGDTLVLAEPEPRLPERGGRPGLEAMLARAGRMLLVLPKRLPGPPVDGEPRWVASSSLRPLEQPRALLEPLGLDVQRSSQPAGSHAWQSPRGLPVPQPVEPLQLLVPSARLEPWLACEAGVLVGLVREAGHELVVLADPDPLAHHALGRDGNAAFALALLQALRGTGRLVWDETWQGHVAQARAAPLLLEPPAGLVTASLALVALLALGVGMSRFGPPPAPGTTGQAPAGREALVDSAARLLGRGDPREAVLRAYAAGAEREALEAVGGARLPAAAARAALDARARARSLPPPAALHARVEAVLARGRPTVETLLGEAQHIHRWKEEVPHGRRRDP